VMITGSTKISGSSKIERFMPSRSGVLLSTRVPANSNSPRPSGPFSSCASFAVPQRDREKRLQLPNSLWYQEIVSGRLSRTDVCVESQPSPSQQTKGQTHFSNRARGHHYTN